MNFLKAFFCLFFISNVYGSDELDFYSEDNLIQLFKDEKHVIVLLGENEECTGKCKELERTLLSAREELVEETESWVVRSYTPNFSKEMGLEGSVIMFMREGRPLVYQAKMGGQDFLVDYFRLNKKSSVHNLTDSNFEHETQAGTGATTGDWLVMFIRNDCEECRKFIPVFEAVSAKLKGQKNAAFVDREYGAVTTRRFGIKTLPTFILFRLGHLYRYTFDRKDTEFLVSFAKDTFRNAKKEKVPMPKSPFDDFTESVVDWIREYPGTFLSSICGVIAAAALLILLNRPPPESWTKKQKRKKA